MFGIESRMSRAVEAKLTNRACALNAAIAGRQSEHRVGLSARGKSGFGRLFAKQQ